MSEIPGPDQGKLFGAWFREARESAGLTRQQLADKAKLTVDEIVLIEEARAGARLESYKLIKLILMLRVVE